MPELFDFETFPVLTTERLRLRQFVASDADAMMRMFSDPRVLQYLSFEPLDTREKAIERMNWHTSLYDAEEGVDWAITERDSDTLIGMCGGYGWDRENRRIELGYDIDPAHWGKGYATEAVTAAIAWMFEHLDLHRIQADCTDGNLGSERVLLKCGFSVEGIRREDCWEHGRFVDSKVFGLLRRDFKMPSVPPTT
jgi:ribosomal-protein-alanine N-acetyltransferase